MSPSASDSSASTSEAKRPSSRSSSGALPGAMRSSANVSTRSGTNSSSYSEVVRFSGSGEGSPSSADDVGGTTNVDTSPDDVQVTVGAPRPSKHCFTILSKHVFILNENGVKEDLHLTVTVPEDLVEIIEESSKTDLVSIIYSLITDQLQGINQANQLVFKSQFVDEDRFFCFLHDLSDCGSLSVCGLGFSTKTGGKTNVPVFSQLFFGNSDKPGAYFLSQLCSREIHFLLDIAVSNASFDREFRNEFFGRSSTDSSVSTFGRQLSTSSMIQKGRPTYGVYGKAPSGEIKWMRQEKVAKFKGFEPYVPQMIEILDPADAEPDQGLDDAFETVSVASSHHINFAVPSSMQPSRNRQSFGHGVVGGSVAHAQVMNSERETSLRHQRTAINFASPPAPSPVPRRQARDSTAFVVPGTIDPHRSRSMRLNLLQGETEQQRSSVLNTLALGKIETATKRNGDTVPDMYKFSKSLPLTWWYNFSARCFTKNIYCPRPIDFSLSLPMGTDWENGGLPLKLYSRFHEYGTALKEDLIWCTKDMEKSITELISIAPNGYVALYNLIAVGMASFLQYNIVDASLLEYSRTDSIALRVRKVHEHVLQNHIIGNFPSQWQVWEYVVGRLPSAERNYLNNYAVQLLSDYPSCDRHNNVPVQLRIEFIASTITSALDVGGFKPGSPDRSNFPNRFVRSLEAADPCTNADEEDAEDRMLHVVRKLSRSTKCFFCGSESHRWRDCVEYKVVDKKTGAPLASPDASTKQVAAIVDSAAQDSSIDDAIDLNVFTLSTLRTTSTDESSPFCYNCSSYGHYDHDCPLVNVE